MGFHTILKVKAKLRPEYKSCPFKELFSHQNDDHR